MFCFVQKDKYTRRWFAPWSSLAFRVSYCSFILCKRYGINHPSPSYILHIQKSRKPYFNIVPHSCPFIALKKTCPYGDPIIILLLEPLFHLSTIKPRFFKKKNSENLANSEFKYILKLRIFAFHCDKKEDRNKDVTARANPQTPKLDEPKGSIDNTWLPFKIQNNKKAQSFLDMNEGVPKLSSSGGKGKEEDEKRCSKERIFTVMDQRCMND